MDTLLYSPDATYWSLRGPEVHRDKDNVIRKPVRQYTYKGVLYTILVCIYANDPNRGIFYELEVKRPIDENFPTKPDTDFRIVKRLLAYAPITIEQYRNVEVKLCMKVAKIRQGEVKCDKKQVNDKAVQYIEEVNDDAGSFGGIMGVYCGTSLHEDHSHGIVTDGDSIVG